MTDERPRFGPYTRAIRATLRVPVMRPVAKSDLLADVGQASEAARGA